MSRSPEPLNLEMQKLWEEEKTRLTQVDLYRIKISKKGLSNRIILYGRARTRGGVSVEMTRREFVFLAIPARIFRGIAIEYCSFILYVETITAEKVCMKKSNKGM